ncbi:MAG: hypothetical protein KGK08_14485 [Acidobacteriota bacterium]|nr:hypothetical protein [Acidobacteriota bacterium]
MSGLNLTRNQGATSAFFALLASSVVLMAGCANMTSTATSAVSPQAQGVSISGHLHGGNQPVAFATVTLNFAGQSRSATASTVAATTTTADDNAGSFSFIIGTPGTSYPNTGNTFSCPTNGSDPVVYLKAVGGNTLNTHSSSVNNSAAVFLAPLGLCSQISNSQFVDLSEVSTVATIAAMQQYFFPSTDTFAADGIGFAKTAITNSAALVSTMVDLSNGTARSTLTQSGGADSAPLNYMLSKGVSSVSATATIPAAKINTIANIISACVNNASSSATACSALFSFAAPPNPTFTSLPPGTTLSAATDVAQAAYYMLTNPTDSTSTNLSNLYNLAPAVGAPYQPTLASAPSDWTIGIKYSSTSTCGTSSGAFLGSPTGLSIDPGGNVWIANNQSTGNLAALTATGAPATCLYLSGGASSTVVDDKDNIWVNSGTTSVFRYSPSSFSTLTLTTPDVPLALAADGLDNIYYSTATSHSLYLLTAAAAPGATNTLASILVASNIGSANQIFPDSLGEIWSTTGTGSVNQTAVTFTSGAFSSSATHSYTVTGSTNGIQVSNNLSGNTSVYVLSSQGDITQLSGTGSTFATVSGFPFSGSGLQTPSALALDGALNSWAANTVADPTSGTFGVVEATNGAAALSPTAGFLNSDLTTASSMVIDQSGNVWIANGNNIEELVGAAVPMYQPYAIGLTNNRFQTQP